MVGRSATATTAIFLFLVQNINCQNYFYQNGFWYPQEQQSSFYAPNFNQNFDSNFLPFYQPQQQQQSQQQFQQQSQPFPAQQIVPYRPQATLLTTQQLPPPRPTRPPPPPPPSPQFTQLLIPKVPLKDEQVEFDLPPPPPSQFLPEEEKIKIARFLSQQQQRPNAQFIVESNNGVVELTRQNNQQRVIRPQFVQQTIAPRRRITTIEFKNPLTQSPPTPQPQHRPLIETEPRRSNLLPTAGGKINPNKIFLTCCKNKKVDKTCESRCNYDKLTKKVLTQMFIGTDPCPQRYGIDLFMCAAQEGDHTPCCRSKNVHLTTAGDKCLAFCKMTPDSPPLQADASYLPCWAVLNQVKTCFKDSILNGLII